MQQHYTNDTDKPQYVGGKLVPAGETRLVDLPLIATPAAAQAPQDPLRALAAGKVTDIVAALPTLDIAAVDQLQQIEEARDKPRSTLIQALELRRLEIINVKAEGAGGTDAPPAADSDDTSTTQDPPAGNADGDQAPDSGN